MYVNSSDLQAGLIRKRRGLDTSNRSWKPLGYPCLGDSSRAGHWDLGQVLDKLSIQTRVWGDVLSLNNEQGNRIRLSGLLSSHPASSPARGTCPGCTACCQQPISPVLPPHGGPPLQHIHHSSYFSFPDLLWSLPSSSLRMIPKGFVVVSHHFFSAS